MEKQKPDLLNEHRIGGWGDGNGINILKGLDDLCQFHGLNNTHKVLELGVCDGVSTSLFAYYAKSVTAVDVQKTSKLERTLKQYPNIYFLHKSIYEIVSILPTDYFDFIYIDADHSKLAVMKDIAISIPKLKHNGILCGHDYYKNDDSGQQVKAAVDLLFKGKKVNVFDDSSWSVQITK